jgi:uncharacterized protein
MNTDLAKNNLLNVIPANSSKIYALVTCASKGLGRCFALELAKRGINSILVALPGDGVSEVPRKCKELGVESVYFETDLVEKENILKLINWVKQNSQLSMLINNAGQGATHCFAESNLELINSLIQLNIASVSLITHQLLPKLMSNKPSHILNVSSLASFSPMGYKAVYSATKCYIQHFSKALEQGLKSTGVSVSVVHPGPMKTNTEVIKRISHHKFFGKFGLLEPEYVASESIRRMLNGNSAIMIGFTSKVNWILLTQIPSSIRLPLIARSVRKEMELNNKTE